MHVAAVPLQKDVQNEYGLVGGIPPAGSPRLISRSGVTYWIHVGRPQPFFYGGQYHALDPDAAAAEAAALENAAFDTAFAAAERGEFPPDNGNGLPATGNRAYQPNLPLYPTGRGRGMQPAPQQQQQQPPQLLPAPGQRLLAGQGPEAPAGVGTAPGQQPLPLTQGGPAQQAPNAPLQAPQGAVTAQRAEASLNLLINSAQGAVRVGRTRNPELADRLNREITDLSRAFSASGTRDRRLHMADLFAHFFGADANITQYCADLRSWANRALPGERLTAYNLLTQGQLEAARRSRG
jgi:hypothetical protein